MNYGIQDLREAVFRLEKALTDVEAEEVDLCVRLIKNIATQIKSEFWAEHVEAEEIVIQPVQHKKDFRFINTIEFLYKPMFFSDAFETNEIEYYSRERTEELVESGAIDAHNNFWQMHETIFGNVYGSVPMELLEKESVGKLIRCGWKKVGVDIIEYHKDYDAGALRKIAAEKYRHYIIVRELQTKSFLVLRYNF